MNGINFNTLRGALYYPRKMIKSRSESPYAHYISGQDGIVNVRIYRDGEDITESMGGFPVDEKDFLEYAKDKLGKGDEQDIGYDSLFPWADLDFEFHDTDELLKGISERYDLENAKQGDLCRILSLLVQGGVISKTDYWDGQAIVPVAGAAEDFPVPKESDNLVRDYYDNFEEFVDKYGGAYSENVRERLQMSLLAHRKIDLIFQQIQAYRYE